MSNCASAVDVRFVFHFFEPARGLDVQLEERRGFRIARSEQHPRLDAAQVNDLVEAAYSIFEDQIAYDIEILPCAVCGGQACVRSHKKIVRQLDGAIMVLLLTAAHCGNCIPRVSQMMRSRYASVYASRLDASLASILDGPVSGVVRAPPEDIAMAMLKFIEGKEQNSAFGEKESCVRLVYSPQRLFQGAELGSMRKALDRIVAREGKDAVDRLGRKLAYVGCGQPCDRRVVQVTIITPGPDQRHRARAR